LYTAVETFVSDTSTIVLLVFDTQDNFGLVQLVPLNGTCAPELESAFLAEDFRISDNNKELKEKLSEMKKIKEGKNSTTTTKRQSPTLCAPSALAVISVPSKKRTGNSNYLFLSTQYSVTVFQRAQSGLILALDQVMFGLPSTVDTAQPSTMTVYPQLGTLYISATSFTQSDGTSFLSAWGISF